MTARAIGAILVRMVDKHDSSPLSIRALDLARVAVSNGIRGGMPGWGRWRGELVDGYQREVGLALSATRSHEGYPWCIAAQYANHKAAERPGELSQCPRTASVLRAAAAVPGHCKLAGPRPGAVGFLEHADGVHGHAVQCEVAWPDGSVTSVEGDTSADGSSTGDSWGRHTWNPADGKRGKLLFWADLGLQPPPVTPAPASDPTPPPADPDPAPAT